LGLKYGQIFSKFTRSPAKIKNLPLGEETGDSETGDRRWEQGAMSREMRIKKTRDNYPSHKTENYRKFI